MTRPRIAKHVTYANVMATIAVFGVLAGGTAWALGKNTVGSAQIKQHSVALSDLRDFKHVRKQVSPSATNNTPAIAQAAAKKVVLMKKSGLTIYGKCWRDGDSDVVYSNAYVKTSADGALMVSYEGDTLDGPFLKKSTPELDREIDSALSASANSIDNEDHDNQVMLVPKKGNGHLYLNVHSFPKNGSIAGGNGPFKSGDRCMFLVDSVG